MSALYGVNYTKYNTGPTEANLVARGVNGGNVKCLLDTYEASSTTAEDTVAIGKPLKAGDIIVGFSISTDAMGGSTVISIGDSDTEARYLLNQDSSSALSGNNAILVGGMNYVIGTNSGDTTILLTLGDAAATGTIEVAILYIES